jgi:hypothetical protein
MAIHPSHQPVSKKFIFVIAIAFFGVCSVVSGVINLAFSLNGGSPGPAGIALIQTGYELSMGVLILVSAWMFARGKFLSVWLYGACMLIDSLYHVSFGYPLNYLFVGFGVFLIWQILQVKDGLELV